MLPKNLEIALQKHSGLNPHEYELGIVLNEVFEAIEIRDLKSESFEEGYLSFLNQLITYLAEDSKIKHNPSEFYDDFNEDESKALRTKIKEYIGEKKYREIVHSDKIIDSDKELLRAVKEKFSSEAVLEILKDRDYLRVKNYPQFDNLKLIVNEFLDIEDDLLCKIIYFHPAIHTFFYREIRSRGML